MPNSSRRLSSEPRTTACGPQYQTHSLCLPRVPHSPSILNSPRFLNLHTLVSGFSSAWDRLAPISFLENYSSFKNSLYITSFPYLSSLLWHGVSFQRTLFRGSTSTCHLSVSLVVASWLWLSHPPPRVLKAKRTSKSSGEFLKQKFPGLLCR